MEKIMSTQTISKFKWFWAWQDEKEEGWLSEMSADGYHLQTSHSFGYYTFVSGEPANYTYRLDYLNVSREESESYYQLFEDAGWEFIGAMAGWQYFRIPTPADEQPEIYTDPESKIKKYERLIYTLLLFLPIFVIFLAVWNRNLPAPIELPVTILIGSLMILFAVSMFKIIQRINQLKRR
jgi:hypothetical protein